MLVVNMFGVPGAGKSKGTAYIFAKLKMLGINAEQVTEFVKDKVYEKSQKVFENQAYIFGKQSFKLSRIKDEVEVAITDSPLPLSIFYNTDEVLGEPFNKVVMNVFNSYESVNYLILRIMPYNPSGRFQTEAESDALAEPMKNLLINNNISYTEKPGDLEGYDSIVNEIYALLRPSKEAKSTKKADVKEKKTSRKSYEVINHGFNSHDCCSELECPECHTRFNSYQITIGKAKCPNPNCGVKLHGSGTF